MAEPGYREEIFEHYLSSIYSHLRNDLSASGLARSVVQLGREFGRFLPADRGAEVLEIGCGKGSFLSYCQSQGYEQVQGIDISPEQVEFCHRNGLANVECIDALSYLEGKNLRFDWILMSDVLEHCTKPEALELLNALHRALQSGGRLVLRVPNMSNPFSLRTRYVDLTHEVGWTQESLGQVLAATGFEVETVEPSVGRHRNLLARWIFDQALWRLFRWFRREVLWLDDEVLRGKNLLGVARKAAR